MFQLSIIKDTVAIHPSDFAVPPEQSIIFELNKKYSNKVLHDLGLCITVFDLSQVGEGKVRYGDGFLWYTVIFRLVVFRPFVSEVLLAKVKSSDEESVRLSLGFFDDIYIPRAYLPTPSAFDPSERAYFWVPDFENPDNAEEPPTIHHMLDTPTSARMYIDSGEVLRVRVESDDFFDFEPGPPKSSTEPPTDSVSKRAPYSILCSIAEQGLGPVVWWNLEEAEGDVVMEEG